MSDQDRLKAYLEKLGSEIMLVYQVAREQFPTGTDEEIRDRAVELYDRMISPALFRVGVTFTLEQESQIRSLVKTGKTQDAQNIILDELGKEFGDGTC